jgi:GNAT superfamily N-acetyltransferase
MTLLASTSTWERPLGGRAARPEQSTRAVTAEQWRLSIRILQPTEVAHFRDHLLRLGPDCRRARFGSWVSDDFLRDYAARVDFTNTMVLGCFVAGEMRGTCEVRSLHSTWSKNAELAFSVEKDWRLQGIGTALMERAIQATRALSIEHLYLTCALANRVMQRLAIWAAAALSFADGECFGDIALCREPPAATKAAA